MSKEEGEQLAQKLKTQFLETSAKSNENIDNCFQILTEEIYDKLVQGLYPNNLENCGIKLLNRANPNHYNAARICCYNS